MNTLRALVEDTVSGNVAAFTTNRMPVKRKPIETAKAPAMKSGALVQYVSGYRQT